jgi:hypothetical protein
MIQHRRNDHDGNPKNPAKENARRDFASRPGARRAGHSGERAGAGDDPDRGADPNADEEDASDIDEEDDLTCADEKQTPLRPPDK